MKTRPGPAFVLWYYWTAELLRAWIWNKALHRIKNSPEEIRFTLQFTITIYTCSPSNDRTAICFVWDLSRTIQEIWPELHWNWTPESISPAEHLDRQSLESFKENYINAMLLFLCVLQIFFETRIYRAEQMHCAPKPAKNCQQLVSFNSHYAFSVTIKPCEYYAS